MVTDLIELEEKVDLIFKKIKKPQTIEKIFEKFEITDKNEKDLIKMIINKKIDDYSIIETSAGKYININKTTFRKGRFSKTSHGGMVYVDHFYVDKNGNEQYYETTHKINENDILTAIDGDEVLIDIISNDNKVKKDSKIVKVINRKFNRLVGEVYKEGNSYFVKPEESKKKNLIISLGNDVDVVVGEKVSVDLGDMISNNFYLATIKKKIGHKDDPEIDIMMEAYKNGIEVDFSDEAIDQVNKIPNKVEDIDKIGRIDLTKEEIFTIDGDDTKDIDDAISLKILSNGNYQLGVHIADPAYYVLEDSILDDEACRRGTSAYLANRVIPMFPHKLSNGICSLNPGVDRLAQSCVMEIDKQGKVVNYSLNRSVIKSNIQMTYDKVNDILNNNVVASDYESHADTLKKMNLLAKILNARRNDFGALEINRPELKIVLDENGKPIKIDKRVQDTGEKLIEEFMLVANETICKHLTKKLLPTMNRVHEEPDLEKLTQFIKLLEITGNRYSGELDTDCKSVQKISKFIDKIDNNEMLQLQFLKSLKRAKYSSTEYGHSGLAKKYYCHFTSPMRRGPDLIQNRILSDFVYNNPTDKEKDSLISKWIHKLPELSENFSKKERIADQTEREVLLMKCAEYMQQFKGDVFEGTIIDMDSNSIYVQLDNMIEGRVRPRNYEGKYFYNENTKSLISLDGGDDYYLGDKLSLKLIDSNKEKKSIDFTIKEKLNENNNILKKENSKEKIRQKQKQMYYNSNKGKR